MLTIIQDTPPIFEEARALFGDRVEGAIFAWGDRIYNPSGVAIPPSLVAHEMVHAQRQNGDPAGWWKRYLADAEFRFDEELVAHRREFQFASAFSRTPRERRWYLKEISRRLAGPLYGHMVTFGRAKKLIRRDASGRN